MYKVVIGGWLKLPTNLVDVNRIKKDLTYKSPYTNEDGTKSIIHLYKEVDDYIYIPRKWRTDYTDNKCVNLILDLVDKPIQFTNTKLPDPYHPKVLDKQAQKQFMDDMFNSVSHNHVSLCMAMTGSGKTVCALNTAVKLGQKTIVLVPTIDLKNQWIKEIETHLGIPSTDVGVIQGKVDTSKDKCITIAVMKTIANRPDDTYYFNEFGFVILDECHKVSTKYFADVVAKFNAKYRLGLTATPKRKDKADIILYSHFGDIAVIAETKAMEVDVWVKQHFTENVWGTNDREIIASLSRNSIRNAMLVDIIARAYNSGRTILAVSNSVKHVQNIKNKLAKVIPTNDIGQLTATKFIAGKQISVKADEIALAKTKRVILATDGFVKEGTDIPLLDCGVDLIPFYNATQRIGRVRRYLESKQKPLWITIQDVGILECDIMYKSRLKDYNDQGFTIKAFREKT